MVAEPKQVGWQFWLQWLVATLVGVAVGAVLAFAGELSTVRATGSDFGDLVFGAGLGLGIGVCQRWVLRRAIPTIRFWVWASASGHAIGLFARNAMIPHVSQQVLQWGGFGVEGLAVGFTEWLVLRKHVSQAGWWIAGSLVAYGVAYGLGEGRSTVIGVAGLVIEPAIRGSILVWLLQRHRAQVPPVRRSPSLSW